MPLSRPLSPSLVLRPRLVFTGLVALLLFGAGAYRFLQLQVMDGPRYREFSENNHIIQRRIPAERGLILDRRERILVKNRPNFQLWLNPSRGGRRNEDFEALANALGFSSGEREAMRRRLDSASSLQPVMLQERLDRDMVAKVETGRSAWPSAEIQSASQRHYPHGTLLGPVIGYIGEISRAQLDRMPLDLYRQGDLVGVTGLEARYEQELHGRPGFRSVLIDARGHEVAGLSKKRYESWLGQFTAQDVPPVRGQTIVLTIDLDLQQEAEAALEGQQGAIVMMDVRTGALLALASVPSFNPDALSPPLLPGVWSTLSNDPTHPLVNKATRQHYPPGSIFKVVTALSALEHGKATAETTVGCPGRYRVGNRDYRCWNKHGHGPVSMHDSIVRSCDVFYYEMGMRLGIDALAETAEELGLGRATGLDMPGEIPGIMPSTAWKRRVLKDSWYDGENTSAAIGQGYVLVTPLQMARLYAYLAWPEPGLVVPALVERITGDRNEILYQHEPRHDSVPEIALEHVALMRKALHGVVNEPGGTGHRAAIEGFAVSGKTGTAQVVRQEEPSEHDDTVEYKLRDHAWFTAFAPHEQPEVSISVIVLHGGHGGAAAAPIARRMLARYKEIRDASASATP